MGLFHLCVTTNIFVTYADIWCMVKDLAGQRFGSLIVLRRALDVDMVSVKSNRDSAHWVCQCACGNIQVFRGTSLRHHEYFTCSSCAKTHRLSKLREKIHINRVGEVFNQLTITEMLPNSMCRAKCTCGKEIVINTSRLVSGNTKSCGCLKVILSDHAKTVAASRRKPLDGQIFGYLTALHYDHFDSAKKCSMYKCRCICGNEVLVKRSYLVNGEVSSCGCKTASTLSLAKGGTGIPYEHVSISEMIRGLPRYAAWRSEVFKKYNYTCDVTGTRGGTLVVHHKIPLNILVSQNNITKETLAQYDSLIFDVSNGIVLSEEVHIMFHSMYGHSDIDGTLFEQFKHIYTGLETIQ